MRALPPARLAPAVLTGSVALFMAAWVAGAPPGEGPDQREHYVKAAGAGGGQLVGRKPPGLEQLADNVVKARDDDAPATTPEASRDALKQLGFNLKATREFDIPRRLTPSFRCSNLLVFRHPELPVRCRARKLPPPGAGAPRTKSSRAPTRGPTRRSSTSCPGCSSGRATTPTAPTGSAVSEAR